MKVPVSVAMRIAKVSQNRFNEAIARGHYRCAPETVSGSGRAFDADAEMIGLCVFGRLLPYNFSAREAAAYACNVQAEIEGGYYQADKVHLVSDEDGQVHQHIRAKGQPSLTFDRAAVVLTIDLDQIRAQIAAGLAKAEAEGSFSTSQT